MASATEEHNVEFYFLLTNLNLNSHGLMGENNTDNFKGVRFLKSTQDAKGAQKKCI